MTENRSNYFCNLERTEELNERILSRNIPINFYYPVFENKPECTKYQKFPTVNAIKNENIKMGYKTKWTEYSSNINKESCLRNQIYPRSNCTNSHYIPSSNSDLYTNHIYNGNNSNDCFSNLYQEVNFNSNMNNNLGDLGNDKFNNHTRQQLKNL